MGASIKIKRAYDCPIEPEHTRGIRTFLTRKDTGSQTFEHIDYSIYYANGTCPKHIHENSEEIFYFIRGTGTFFLGDREFSFKPGDHVCVPKGMVHGLRCDNNDTVEHIVCCIAV